MRRWTDGKSWSASRVSGSFLTYREMEGKRGGASVAQTAIARADKTPESTRGSDEDRLEVDDGQDGYRYKPDGLMKQSFSITTSAGQHLHLISYYARSHPSAAVLQQPCTDPTLRHVRPQKGLYPESTVNDQQNLPAVTRAPMAGASYSISPHPVGPYGRSGATHPQSYTPPYPWPPTPLATPPTVPVAYGHPYLPPAPASNGHAPPYGHHHPSLPLPQPGPSAPYDRPVHAGETFPHSIPPPNGHAASGPGYGGPPRPGTAHASPHTPNPVIPNGHNQTWHNSPKAMRQSPSSGPHPPPATSGQSPTEASNHMPGIGSMISGRSPGQLPSIRPPNSPSNRDPADPTAAGQPDGPRDIPTEKIAFGGEDMRALRQLDRVFSA